MSNPVQRMSVEAAIQDLQGRTLGELPGTVAQLVYLASTRDYNTGQYYHDGLAFRHTEEVARVALAAHHKRIFRELVFCPLEALIQQLELYINSSRVERSHFLGLWKKIEPFRVTVPMDCDPLSVELFFSNLKVALAILLSRQ
jgi:hypothetical protein